MIQAIHLLRKAMVFVSMAAVFAACNNGATDNATTKPSNNEPFKITMMNQSVLAEPTRADDPIIKVAEKHTNTKLEIQWVPNSTYNEKLNATIASGMLPMVILVNQKPLAIVNAVRSGQFWEIGPYLKDYPNLEKAQDKRVIKKNSIDGKTYSIFRSRSQVGDGILFRSDWSQSLGLNPPTNVDELYNMIKAFTLNDPDKNGKNDTVGLAEESALRGFNFLMAAHGGGNEWELKDGKLAPTLLSKPYLDTLNFYKRLYKEKLMNLDFAVTNRVQNIDNINKGFFGLRLGDPENITRYTDLLKVNPKAEIDVKTDSIKDIKLLAKGGGDAHFFFPKQSIKSEEELKKILAFFDKLSDHEGQNLFEWGIVNIHYSIENGIAKRTPEQTAKYNAEVVPIQQEMQVADGSGAMQGEVEKIVAKYKDARRAVDKNLLNDPAASYSSKTFEEKGSELTKLINDSRIKYIMGDLDEAGWKGVQDKWLKGGGDKIIIEINELYVKDTNK
jgi:putative aldouronate transport system substrate-binding protein